MSNSKSSRHIKDDAIYSTSQITVRKIPDSLSKKIKAPFADIGEDVYFYVSGTRDGRFAVDRRVAVFGGDVVISGSLKVEGCELTGSFEFDCNIFELTGTMDVEGSGKFKEGLSTLDLTTLAGDPFIVAGGGITVSSDPSSGQLVISQNIEWNEKLSGEIDGVNSNFTLTYAPSSPSSMMVFINGVLQEAGSEADFTIMGNIVTFKNPPLYGSKVTATYSR